MSKVIHEPWQPVTVRQIIEKHFCGPSPDCEERQIFKSDEWGVLKTTAITWSGWDERAHKVLPKAYWNQPDIEVHAGDVLVTKAGPRHRVGVVCYVPSTRSQLVVSGKMIGLRPKTSDVEPVVLAGLIAQQGPQKYIQDRTTGMAESQVNFANEVLLNTPLNLPPRKEQLVIAKISECIDTAIYETEAIISKLKAVKQGLLHDLLTRGIDANGELRPSQAEAPHLYKESPLGWIPKDWDAPTLALACSLIRDGTHLPPVRVADGPLLLSVRNLQDGQFILTDQDTRVSESFYRLMHKHWEVRVGDVLLAIVGATIGKTAVVGDMPKFTLQRSVAVLRGKPEKLLNPFLHLYIGSPAFQSLLWAQVNQTAQPGIYLDQLGAIRVPLPAPAEQEVIQERLRAVQSQIDEELRIVQKMKTQKSGLMDDLLTGRVRVTTLLNTNNEQGAC